MILKKLELKNFRNYENLELEFSDRLNIIIGNNAQGKTNILESIYFLSVTKSFLNLHEKSLINNGSKCAILNSVIIKDNNKINLSILLNNLGKKIKIGNNEVKKISD